VVVDDGSVDGSGAEVAAVAAQDSRFRLVTTTGVGAVAARGLGVAATTAPYLAFTDSDCVPAPQWLAQGLQSLEDGADVAQGPTVPARPPRALERTVWVTVEDGLYATCNVFYRRTAFDAAGGFDGRLAGRLGFRPDRGSRALGLGEDTVLGWRVRRAGVAAWAPAATVTHHVFPVDVGESLRRAWSVGAFPALVREVPELRQTLLRDGIWLGGRWRIPLYAGMVAGAARRPGLAAFSLGAWVAVRGRRLRRNEPSWRRLAKALPVDLACDAVAGSALIVGSARSRRCVL
jgi:glycosyltransferase involved in cell wall biosynthesis